jgi:hypothetical protein
MAQGRVGLHFKILDKVIVEQFLINDDDYYVPNANQLVTEI